MPSLRTANGKLNALVLSALRVIVALVLAFLISQIRLDYVESALYDARMRLRPAPAASGHVEIVLIDPKTIEALKGAPGFAEHQLFLERLAAVGAKAVVYDMNILGLRGTDEERARFAETAERIPGLVFLTDQLEMKGEDALRFSGALRNLRLESGPKSSDSSNFAKDGVTRRFLIRYQDQLMAHIGLARLFRPGLGDSEPIRGSFGFLGTEQAYINFRPPRSYPVTPFAAVMEKRTSLEGFRDKIVILGEDTQVSERDYARTPYSREAIGMTSAEVHANIVDTLLRNDSPVKSPRWFDAIWVAAISILTVYVVFAVKPAQGLIVLLSTMAGFSALSALAFGAGGFWMDMAHPLLAVFLCYYFLIPYRLIIENRSRWEIYQKHKLLQQVEELKTNFISMMSHDLKTPIARIQGMTDVIERDPAPLSAVQREALDTVRSSSADLLQFINAILQYGSIESQHLHLRRASRDVNDLIDSAIKQNEFLAKIKRIRIRAELEPLFPISVDPELIRQVFSNLIENAVKYSPEDTRILVSSEEEGDFVVVQIADQGPGIPPEELPNLFMKFFRSRNAKTSPIKGSGLGLYLARYFTELHDGTVSVESSYGQGTTFTVKLPLSTGGSDHVESTRR